MDSSQGPKVCTGLIFVHHSNAIWLPRSFSNEPPAQCAVTGMEQEMPHTTAAAAATNPNKKVWLVLRCLHVDK